MAAYLLLTDWQTIPYDPCTEYSPFHHPEIFKNQSKHVTPASTSYYNSSKINLQSELLLQFESGAMLHPSGNMDTIATCSLNSSCPLCEPTIPLHQKVRPCLIFATTSEKDNSMHDTNTENVSVSQPLRLSCSSDGVQTLCINIITQGMHHFEKEVEHHQTTHRVTMYSQYSIVSNSCINAHVPGRECQWIPYSIITNSVCNDCPPICRGKGQTLNIVQFSAGIFALLVAKPNFWIPLMSIATDHSPKRIRVCVLILMWLQSVYLV